MKRYLIALLLIGCGLPDAVVPVASTEKTANAATTATATVTEPTEPAPPLDGEWTGGWSQSYIPSTAGGGADGTFCSTVAYMRARVIDVSGTLTIAGTSATFKGVMSDTGDRVQGGYCMAYSATTAVEQTLKLTINDNSVDAACVSDCGSGLGDWRIGTEANAIVALRTDSDTHLKDQTSTVFDTFEFWKK